ncbi:MAG: bL21 family ribosomal protein [Bacteroidota bacterium]
MFAIVKIAGQQFRVSPGQSLYVPHLAGNPGDAISFDDLLLFDNCIQVQKCADVN